MLNGGPVAGRNLIAQFAHCLLALVDQAVGRVARLDQFLATPVIGLVALGLAHLIFHLRLAEVGACRDGDLLLSARGLVLGRHIQDAVGVDVKSDLDLRHTTRCRRDTLQVEATQSHVVPGHRALALEHVDGDCALPIGGGAKDLALAYRNGRVALDEGRHDLAQRLHAEGQGRDVQKEHILDLTRQHASLDSRAYGHHFVRVDALVGFFAPRQTADQLLDHGHARRPTDEDDLIQAVRVHLGVLQGLLKGSPAALYQIFSELLQLGPRELDLQVLRPRGVGRDEGQVDLGLQHAGQLDLGLLGRFLQSLQRLAILAQINALILLEFISHPINNALIPVVAAQERVAAGCLDLDHALTDLQDRHVEGAATQVKDQDRFGLLPVEAVGQRSRRRLVDNAQHFQARNPSGVLGRLALGVVKVGRHGDDGLGHLLAQVSLGVVRQLAQDHGRNLLGSVLPARLRDTHPGITALPSLACGALDDVVGQHLPRFCDLLVVVAPAHKPLHRENCVICVHHGLASGRLPDEPLAVLAKGNYRRA